MATVYTNCWTKYTKRILSICATYLTRLPSQKALCRASLVLSDASMFGCTVPLSEISANKIKTNKKLNYIQIKITCENKILIKHKTKIINSHRLNRINRRDLKVHIPKPCRLPQFGFRISCIGKRLKVTDIPRKNRFLFNHFLRINESTQCKKN